MALNQQSDQTSTESSSFASVAQKISGRLSVILILLGILLIGSYFRFVGINWDEFTHLHPDERFLTIVTSSLDGESSLVGYLRTSTSQLNPYNHGEGLFVYGNFPMTVTFYAGELADRLQPSLCDGGWASAWQARRSPIPGRKRSIGAVQAVPAW